MPLMCLCMESYPPQKPLAIISPEYNWNNIIQCVHTYSQASTNICKAWNKRTNGSPHTIGLNILNFQIMLRNCKLKYV